MQADQRIVGYFIEEAKEHLDTIEQGLLNLQSVVEEPEMLNEVFRAAHSIKGGAAMLGFHSIQQTAHWLEDYFKLLKEHPIRVDQTLESLFLQGFDTLRALLEQLQEPDGLTQDVADNAVQAVKPVFAELKIHLAALISQASEPVSDKFETLSQHEGAYKLPVLSLPTQQEENTLVFVLQRDVPARLRSMLQLFKQVDQPANRQQLQGLCQDLAQVGKRFELAAWSELIETAQLAIANPQNSYSTLAPIIIREIKQARDQVLEAIHQSSVQSAEIFLSQKLKALTTIESTLAIKNEFFSQPPVSGSEPQSLDLLESTDVLDDVASLASNNLDKDESDNWTEFPFEAADLPEALSQSSIGADLASLFEDELPEGEVPSPMFDLDFGQSRNDSPTTHTPSEPSLSDLEALLEETILVETSSTSSPVTEPVEEVSDRSGIAPDTLNEFLELEELLEEVVQPERQAEDTEQEELSVAQLPLPMQNATPASTRNTAQPRTSRQSSRGFNEQTMRVPVKHLNNCSNLVGELVVNRNSLEQNQERLRQFLDNLLYQVQQLSNIGQQMQDLYERSLLEASLLTTPERHQLSQYSNTLGRDGVSYSQGASTQVTSTQATGTEFDALEMDRFTGFHTLSQEIIERVVRLREAASDIEFVVDGTDQVSRIFQQVTSQLQEGLTHSRMMPFAQVADRLPRAVRDIALKYGKRANLETEGQDTLIDKGVLEQLYDPITHLVSNALIHGIESPEIRHSAGKPPAGQITIQAFYQGNQTIISVSDDGAGIDPAQVKAKALAKGLLTSAEAEELPQLGVYDLLFSPGFSTKDQADDMAGRGVGMDVVRTSLNEIRGTISIDSTLGQGTTFVIRLPLTLSITKALCCTDNHCQIAFPLDGVEDILDVSEEDVQTNSEGQSVVPWNGSLIPFRPLAELLNYNHRLSRDTTYSSSQDENAISVVVLRSSGSFSALQVDQVLGEQEIVIKQLGGPIPKPTGVAGVTVLGDGRIMPIADVLELTGLLVGRLQPELGSAHWDNQLTRQNALETEPMVLIVDDSITVRELLSMTFNKAGYRVEQARDGQEAWEKLRSGLPCDLMFCDIEMPRMDGLELLSQIQKDSNLQDLPVAMLTSRGAERHRQMAIQLGAKGYFTKPYLEEALLDATRRMLNGEVLVAQNS